MIGVYANAFPLMDENYDGANENVHQLRGDITPESYLHFAKHWADIGADIIGGCCGISPTHINLLAQELKDMPPVTTPEFG
jgi:S-methylmethionine-dependent homocysteine/selenocysteine methylase